MACNEITFCELREKVVINIIDGKKLGHILDISMNLGGKVLGLILPAERRVFKGFNSGDTIFIPYDKIVRIGEDAILVELLCNIGNVEENVCKKNIPM